VDQPEARRLGGLLSRARIGEYLAHCNGDPVAALRLSCWNAEVSAAFYGPLQYLELALRSVLDHRMSVLFGRADWWHAPQVDLHHAAQARITEAYYRLSRSGIPQTPEEIISELPFGFWVGLLGAGHSYDQRLWRTSLHLAFPGYRGRRSVLHRDLDYLRVLRNKIAHHSPIHHRHLQADHDAIVRMLGYIDSGLADLVNRHSPVPAVLARRPHLRTP
jgi:hypothetical protein